jgi:hypothetical protein
LKPVVVLVEEKAWEKSAASPISNIDPSPASPYPLTSPDKLVAFE